MLRFLTRSRRWIAIAVLTVLSVLFGVAACDSSVSGGIQPTTGILIRAETLTTGRGCGRGQTQIYKYAVVVFAYDGEGKDPALRTSYNQPLRSNLFDCYVDGAFLSLPAKGDNQTYRLEVYAYNEAAFTAYATTIASAGTNTSLYRDAGPDFNGVPLPPPPTWTTECTATQSAEVETLAQCDPLVAGLGAFGQKPGPTEIEVATQAFRLPDGRVAVCSPGLASDAGAVDAGTADAGPIDASTTDAADASDAAADAEADAGGADAEAGAQVPARPVAFTTARIRTRIGATITGPAVDITCPNAYVAAVLPENASYTVDVGLLDEQGGIVGQVACEVTTQSGTKKNALCP